MLSFASVIFNAFWNQGPTSHLSIPHITLTHTTPSIILTLAKPLIGYDSIAYTWWYNILST